MPRYLRCMILLCTVAASMLSGCPLMPELKVSPVAITFSPEEESRTVSIINNGYGTLTWATSVDSIAWLTVNTGAAKQTNTALGTISTEVAFLELRLDRDLLPVGRSTAEVLVTSNGGDKTIVVSATKDYPAVLYVTPTTVDFGVSGTSTTLTVRNTGAQALLWEVDDSTIPAWLNLSSATGTVNDSSDSDSITLTASRDGLAAGEHTATLSITSNGGDQDIEVSLTVSPFELSPTSLDFGILNGSSTQQITATNLTASAVNLAASDDAAWLSVAPAADTLPGSGTLAFTVTADTSALAPGEYAGTVTITDAGSGFSLDVPVTVEAAAFTVAPAIIDFGQILVADTNTFTMTNMGLSPIDWSIQISTLAARWLSVDVSSGTLAASTTITVTADPTDVDPGEYAATILIATDAGNASVAVSMVKPLPAALKVQPVYIDFGETRSGELIAVWNGGIGTLNWEADTAAFPAWLSVDGATTGTVSGDDTDSFDLVVDRSAVVGDDLEFEFSFNITSTGDATATVPVTVIMSIPTFPNITITGEGTDDRNIPFVSVSTDEETSIFTILNDGTRALSWEINQATIPGWLSIIPRSGSLDVNTEQDIVCRVDRSGLTFLGAQADIQILSNHPDAPISTLLVEVQVAKKANVTARPADVSIGALENSSSVEVANSGDAGSVLNFQVVSTKEWLSIFPESGQSIGVPSGTPLDFQPFDIAVDRSNLSESDNSSASAKILVIPVKVQNGITIPDDSIPPIEINVSVEVPQLTIETPLPQLRKPSLVRFDMMMRNLKYNILPIPDSRLSEVGDLFVLREKNEELEQTETNQLLKSGKRLRTTVLILLDYSGSMLESAQSVTDATVSGDADPIQALYEATIPNLIDEMPDHYRIGLAVFNERSASCTTGLVRVLRPSVADPIFTNDKAELLARLQNANVIDHGASPLYDSLIQATEALYNDDAYEFLLPFDDADVRALVCVSDGRETSDGCYVTRDVYDYMKSTRTRFFPIGWGGNVATAPMILIAANSGGHFYPTKNEDTGVLDEFGAPIRVPDVDALLDWCETDAIPAEPVSADYPDEQDYLDAYDAYTEAYCDQSIAQDFTSQTKLSYVSLAAYPTATISGEVTFDDPNDQVSPCLGNQGNITGSFEARQIPLFDLINDVRLGQISMHSEGYDGTGAGSVLIQADYIPRNISQLSLLITADDPGVTLNVTQVTEPAGGIIFDWTRSGVAPTYTYTAPGDAVLPYGQHGGLLQVDFTGAVGDFRLLLTVASPTYNVNAPDSKYFTCPDTILIEDATTLNRPFVGSAFPRPRISSVPAYDELTRIISLDAATDDVTFTVNNIGGSHASTLVSLYWSIELDNGTYFDFVLDDLDGNVVSTLTPDSFTLTALRTMEPGDYTGSVTFNYSYGSLFIELTDRPIDILFTVLDPVLDVSPTTLDFPSGTVALPITVTNTGQSILSWSIDDDDLFTFPAWLTVTRSSGNLGPDDSDLFNVSVDPATVAGLPYSFDIVSADGQSTTVTINSVTP